MLTLLAPIAMQGSEHWVFIERESPRLEVVALKKVLGVKKEEARTGTSEVEMSASISKVEVAVGKAKEVAGQQEPADAALDTRTRAKMIASPEDFESVWEDEIYEKESSGEPSRETECLPAESSEKEPQEQSEEATASEPGLPKPCQQPEERQRAKILGPEPPQGESKAVSKEYASAAPRKQEARVPATDLVKIKVKASDDSSETSATQRIIYLGDPEGEEKDSKTHLLLETGGRLGLEERPEATANTSEERSGRVAPVAEGFQHPSSASQQQRTVSGKSAEALEQHGTGCDGTSMVGHSTLRLEGGLPLEQEETSAGLTGCGEAKVGGALPCSREVGPDEMELQSPVGGLKLRGVAGDGHGAEEHRGKPKQSPDICMAMEALSGRTGADSDKEESARVVLQMEEIQTRSPPSAVPQQGHPHPTAGSIGDKPSTPAHAPCPQQSSAVLAELAPGTEPEGRDPSRGTSPVRHVGSPKDTNPSAEVACKEASPEAGKGAPKDVIPVADVAIPQGTNSESDKQPKDMGIAMWKLHQCASPVAEEPPQNTDAARGPIQVRDLATGKVAQGMDSATVRPAQSKVPATEELLQEEKPIIKELSQDIKPASGKLTRVEGCGMEELSHDKSPCVEDLPPKAEEPEKQTEAIVRDLSQESPRAGGLLHTANPKAQEPPWDLEFSVGQDQQGRSTTGETTRDSDLAVGQPLQDESPPKEADSVLHSHSPVVGLCQGGKTYQLSALIYEGGEELQVSSGTHQIESGLLMCVAGRTGAVSQEHGGDTVAPGIWQESKSYRKTSVASKIKMFEQSEMGRRAAQEGQECVPEDETSGKSKGKTGLAQDMLLNTSSPALPVTPAGPASCVGSLALRQGAGSGDTSQPRSLKEDVSVDPEHEEDSADLASPDSGCELTLAEAVVTVPMNCPDGKFMRMLCGSLLSCSVAPHTSVD